MGTRAFIGYRSDYGYKGFSIPNDGDYECTGMKILDKFEEYSKNELKDFFLKRVYFLGDEEELMVNTEGEFWLADWSKDELILEEENEFLNNGLFCDFGYIFDLENDRLELYRGGYEEPQKISNDLLRGYKELFNTYMLEMYTHLTFVVERNDIEKTKKLFRNWSKLYREYHHIQYPEEYYIKNERDIS